MPAPSSDPSEIAVAYTQILRGVGLRVPASSTHLFAEAGLSYREIAQLLAERGARVFGTVRNPQKTSGLEHLHKLSDDHPGRLRLFKAD